MGSAFQREWSEAQANGGAAAKRGLLLSSGHLSSRAQQNPKTHRAQNEGGATSYRLVFWQPLRGAEVVDLGGDLLSVAGFGDPDGRQILPRQNSNLIPNFHYPNNLQLEAADNHSWDATYHCMGKSHHKERNLLNVTIVSCT